MSTMGCEAQAVEPPAAAFGPANANALEQLESILASPQYMEMMESCKNFNKRLLVERKGRVPFIDAHTGLAQSDCRLWMQQRHRMPGVKPGQVYTYPAKRWIKRRRQYLNFFMQPKKFGLEECELAIAAVQNPTFNEDSSASLNDGSKDGWYFEDAEIDRDDFEENSDASDYDFDDRYRKKKKSASSQKRSSGRSSSSRRRAADPDEEAKKPWACELCAARYKTRPGLTYHYAHSHKEERRQEQRAEPGYEPPPSAPDQDAAADGACGAELLCAVWAWARCGPCVVPARSRCEPDARAVRCGGVAVPAGCLLQKPELAPAATAVGGQPPPEKKRSTPSLYCDFCLGDATLNKKSGAPEELVSCSDCGRSGHPSCLQFTDNMVISVKKYRWQCIECKCCSLCGTSDNDDQLLFCDDCDRGYHMYCLSPPLTAPPEGSWSCHLCMLEFHSGGQPAAPPAQ
ncbi:zinc finger protein ubi-d4-like [Pollicipes pollicipes]|uniref:zinc finger protein ubi-d4-like n=1 Tax=Pollicipes pollicipes TaxID=41117 RepID=UPI0018858D77|nr:zinc finger protein ubi-d4-like [Pollicipes pollicipes]